MTLSEKIITREKQNALSSICRFELEICNDTRDNCFHLDDRHCLSNARMRASNEGKHGESRIVVLWEAEPAFGFESTTRFNVRAVPLREGNDILFSIFTPDFLPGVHDSDLV